MIPSGDDRTGAARPANGDAARDQGRARDGALILPIAGLILLCPPLLSLFVSDEGLLGTPLIVCYVFAVWAVLIVVSRKIAQSLGHSADIDE